MKTRFLDPLARLVRETLAMMGEVEAREVSRQVKEPGTPEFEISSFIGITGEHTGGIVLSFEREAARHITTRMLGGEDGSPGDSPDDEDVYDCVGEVANIVAGNFLSVLSDGGQRNHRISLPSVVVGTHHIVWRSKDGPSEQVIFESECGRFSVELNIV